jgi:hypothetical protein
MQNKSLLVLFGIFLLASTAIAQTKEISDSVRFKTIGSLYRAIQALNNRNTKFKALQDELDAMHPLESQSMDSVHLSKNLLQLTKYAQFLESHRSQLNRNIQLLSDSVKYFSSLMKNEEEKKALDNFLKAYKEESAAFIFYSNKLSKLLLQIRSTLIFLQTVPMERKGDQIVFNTDKSANDKYMEMQTAVNEARGQVDAAIDNSIKTTEKANAIIQESTRVLGL